MAMQRDMCFMQASCCQQSQLETQTSGSGLLMMWNLKQAKTSVVVPCLSCPGSSL